MRASASVVFLGVVAGGNLGAGAIVSAGSAACAKAWFGSLIGPVANWEYTD